MMLDSLIISLFTDKNLAIFGFIVISLYAIYQGGTESYQLVEKIVLAIAGFVTGVAITKKQQ